jgi:hypothetical protein
VYVDESGIENTLSQTYGWARKGERCEGQRLGHATERVSMIAAWCEGVTFAAMMFEGYCDSRVVETYVEQVLLPELRAGQVVILDNASFHRKVVLRELLARVGCWLLPLPSYSPDLNKIEQLWYLIKSLVIKFSDPLLSFHDKVNLAFCDVLS